MWFRERPLAPLLPDGMYSVCDLVLYCYGASWNTYPGCVGALEENKGLDQHPCKLEQAMQNLKTWLQKGITQDVKQLMDIIFQNKPKDFV